MPIKTDLRLEWEVEVRARFYLYWLNERWNGTLEGCHGKRLAPSARLRFAITLEAPALVEASGTPPRLRICQGEFPWLRMEIQPLGAISPLLFEGVAGLESISPQLARSVPESMIRTLRTSLAIRWAKSSPKEPFLPGARCAKSSGKRTLLTQGPSLDREIAVQIHLPFQDRVTYKRWTKNPPPARVEVDPTGRLLVDPDDVQALSLVSAGPLRWTRPRMSGENHLPPVHLCFHHQRSLTSVQAMDWLQPLLESHRIASRLPASSQSWDVAISLWTDGPGLHSWTSSEKRLPLVDLAHEIALAIQVVGRKWVPFEFFSEDYSAKPPDQLWPMLAFQHLKPHAGKYWGDLTFDLLQPAAILEALDLIHRPLYAMMRRLRQPIPVPRKVGQQEKNTALDAEIIAADMLRIPKLLGALLVTEQNLVKDLSALLKSLSAIQREGRGKRPKIARMHSQLEDLADSLRSHLRSMYGGFPFPNLLSLFLIAASVWLARRVGQKAQISACCKLVSADGTEYFAATSNSLCEKRRPRATLVV